MDDLRAVYQALMTAHDSGEPAALITIISVQGSVPRHTGSKLLVRADGSFVGTIGGGKMENMAINEALAAIASGAARTVSYSLNDIQAGDPGVCGGTVELFIDPVQLAPSLLIIGGGHVGKALAELAKWSGWRVILNDDRADFCNPEYAPGLDGYVISKPSEVVQQVKITPSTYIAAVTRGLPVDIDLIPSLIETPAAYIGVIGSRRRWALTVKALREQHAITDAQLARIHAPIGLELNAETPKEIAVSILAEMIMIRRGGTGISMKVEPTG